MRKNDNICMKTTNRSEPYDCTENEETYSLNTKIEVISCFKLIKISVT